MSARPNDVRTAAREAALQMLYALEMGGQTPGQVERWYLDAHPLEPDVRERVGRLFDQAVMNNERIESLIDRHARGWKRERMALVDRSLLKLAIGEMLEREHPPHPVIINEALRLTKKFSQPEAVNFVNGLLHAVSQELRQPDTGAKTFSFRN
jgi:N utilization substance protein B